MPIFHKLNLFHQIAYLNTITGRYLKRVHFDQKLLKCWGLKELFLHMTQLASNLFHPLDLASVAC